jgi:hypothetical protein
VTVLKSDTLKRRESAARFAQRGRNKELVRRRWQSAGCKCEGCGLVCSVVEVAHLFSTKGHVVAKWLADRPELMMALCCASTWGDRNGCHEAIDQHTDPGLRDRLSWYALTRLCAAERIPLSVLRGRDPGGAVRACEDWLAARAFNEQG